MSELTEAEIDELELVCNESGLDRRWNDLCALARKGLEAEKPINKAWEKINALGGATSPSDWDAGYSNAIDRCLREIEELGGRDPLTPAPTSPAEQQQENTNGNPSLSVEELENIFIAARNRFDNPNSIRLLYLAEAAARQWVEAKPKIDRIYEAVFPTPPTKQKQGDDGTWERCPTCMQQHFTLSDDAAVKRGFVDQATVPSPPTEAAPMGDWHDVIQSGQHLVNPVPQADAGEIPTGRREWKPYLTPQQYEATIERQAAEIERLRDRLDNTYRLPNTEQPR